MTFQGFVPDTLDFLRDLGRHNDRGWFAENKRRYERVLLEPQRALVAALGERFATFDPRVRCEPRVDGSIFRIYRDVRFSRDKSPYKTWADIALWIGRDRKTTPGYFIRMVEDSLLVGGGEYHPTGSQLAAMRAAIAGERGAALESQIESLVAAGWQVGDETHARVPAGFSRDSERAWLLRYGRLHGAFECAPPPDEFYGPELVDWMMCRFAEVRPMVDWLADVLREESS